MARWRLGAKVVIERDDTMHLRTRKVQSIRDADCSITRDISQRILNLVQYRQQSAGGAAMRFDDIGHSIAVNKRHSH
jgi:hypothetical protein